MGLMDTHQATEPKQTHIPDRVLRPRQVRKRLNVSRATLYRMIERGELPRPMRLSRGAVGWRERTITEWLDAREEEAAVPRPPRPGDADH